METYNRIHERAITTDRCIRECDSFLRLFSHEPDANPLTTWLTTLLMLRHYTGALQLIVMHPSMCVWLSCMMLKHGSLVNMGKLLMSRLHATCPFCGPIMYMHTKPTKANNNKYILRVHITLRIQIPPILTMRKQGFINTATHTYNTFAPWLQTPKLCLSGAQSTL